MSSEKNVKQFQNFNKYSFLIVFVVGSLGILVLKVFYYDYIEKKFDNYYLMIQIWPILMMFIYLYICISFDKFRLRMDQSGDNLYYMGFLFTLTSLAIALFQFSLDMEKAIGTIISSFGIALSTTIIGVALRVMLHQFHVDPVDLQKETNIEIAESLKNMKSELDSSVIDFNHFRRTITQSLEESFREIGTTANGILKNSCEEIEKVSFTATKSINESFEKFDYIAVEFLDSSKMIVESTRNLADKIDDISIPPNLIENKIEPIIQNLINMTEVFSNKINDSTNQLVKKIHSISIPENIFENKLTPFIDNLEKLVETISSVDRIDNKMVSSMHNAINLSTQSITDLHLHIKDFVDHKSSVVNLLQSVENLIPKINEINAFTTKYIEAYSNNLKLLEELENSSKITLSVQVKNASQAVNSLTSLSEEFNNKLNNVLNKSSSQTLELLSGMSEQQANYFKNVSDEINQTLEFMKINRERSEIEYNKSRDAMSKFIHQLSITIQILTDQISQNKN